MQTNTQKYASKSNAPSFFAILAKTNPNDLVQVDGMKVSLGNVELPDCKPAWALRALYLAGYDISGSQARILAASGVLDAVKGRAGDDGRHYAHIAVPEGKPIPAQDAIVEAEKRLRSAAEKAGIVDVLVRSSEGKPWAVAPTGEAYRIERTMMNLVTEGGRYRAFLVEAAGQKMALPLVFEKTTWTPQTVAEGFRAGKATVKSAITTAHVPDLMQELATTGRVTL